MKEEKIILSTKDMNVTKDGVKPFFWPLKREASIETSEEIAIILKKIIKEDFLNEKKDAKNLVTITPRLYLLLTTIFCAQFLANNFKKNNKKAQIPDGASFWKKVFNDEKIDIDNVTKEFAKGIKPHPLWKKILYPIKNLVVKDGFYRLPIELVNIEKNIICTVNCPLTIERAKRTDKKVIIGKLGDWFYPPKDKNSKSKLGIKDEKANQLIEEIDKLFTKKEAKLSNNMKAYLFDWLKETTGWVEFYKQRLRKQKNKLPKELWIGTSGIVWVRILADIVLENGGKVFGHDHAHGANYSIINRSPIIETQNSTSFTTFNEAQAKMYENSLELLNISGKKPDIEYLNIPSSIESKEKSKESDKKRALFVMTSFQNDTFGPSPMLFPIVAVDWQTRLFNKLKKLGYEILIKPHPESPQLPPDYFEKEYGAKILYEGTFEDVYDKGDILLFDFPLSTTWGFALKTEKPVILFDFGIAPLPKEHKEMLEKRCAVTKCWFDKDNRAQTDWENLEQDLLKAKKLNDKTYARTILG